jgi:hypothetical protein
MMSEGEFWRLNPTAKAESVAQDIDRLIRRARAAGLSATAYILELQHVPTAMNRDSQDTPEVRV